MSQDCIYYFTLFPNFCHDTAYCMSNYCIFYVALLHILCHMTAWHCLLLSVISLLYVIIFHCSLSYWTSFILQVILGQFPLLMIDFLPFPFYNSSSSRVPNLFVAVYRLWIYSVAAYHPTLTIRF